MRKAGSDSFVLSVLRISGISVCFCCPTIELSGIFRMNEVLGLQSSLLRKQYRVFLSRTRKEGGRTSLAVHMICHGLFGEK